MDLVFLVVAGEDVHHEVDAEAVGDFARLLAAIHRQQRPAGLLVDRPGARPVRPADEEAGDAIAAPRIAVGRAALDPEPAVEPAREALDEVIALGQHVVRRRGLERRRIDAGQQLLQVLRDIAARRGIARVDDEGAAGAQIGVDLGDGGRRQRLRIARHGVVDHRIEFERVFREIDAVRRVGLDRGALAELVGQAPQAGARGVVEPAVAGLHVGEAQLGGRLARQLFGRLRMRPAAEQQRSAEEEREHAPARRAEAAAGSRPANASAMIRSSATMRQRKRRSASRRGRAVP